MKSSLAFVCVVLMLSAAANAGPVLNEVFVNPSGTDNGNEFFEIRNLGGGATSLDGLSLLVIEGEPVPAPGPVGTIDLALSLAGLSTGTNGLMLWRDSATVLNPPPAPETVVHANDFPDIENGGQTYLLVSNFTGAVGMDLDTDNDGVLDATPWDAVVDAVGYHISSLSGPPSTLYGAALGGTDIVQVELTADGVFRPGNSPNAWVASDGEGASPGPWTFDPLKMCFSDGTAAGSFFVAPDNQFTPGGANAAMVPEPHVFGLLAAGGLTLLLRRARLGGRGERRTSG